MARTRLRFGFQRRRRVLLAWLTTLPYCGPLPQRSHFNAMSVPADERFVKTRRFIVADPPSLKLRRARPCRMLRAKLGSSGVHPGSFERRMRKRLKRRKMSYRSLQRMRKNERRIGNRGIPTPAVLYDYQNREVARRGFCKSVKEKVLGRRREARFVRIGILYTRQSSMEEV